MASSDICTSGAAGFGNDDFINQQIRHVILDNLTSIFLLAMVFFVTGVVVYYLLATMISIWREYQVHRVTIQPEDYADIDNDDVPEPTKLPKQPQVAGVMNRLRDIEGKYKKYNVEISKRRDGAQYVVDSRIVSRSADNYKARPSAPEPRIRV
jgi:hypothetical protein